MKPLEAAAEYWATLDDVDAAKPIARRHEKAPDVIKKHMAAEGITTFRGIDMVTAPVDRVDLKLLESKDPELVALCRMEGVRRSLIPKRRPKSKAAAV